mmetsp:Transcript_63641/g.189640  ORF Transcript_63641/g.189640 Transcript_63641/m.189640 type:complete len:286 (+) Transcript_63641:962-1819(+)
MHPRDSGHLLRRRLSVQCHSEQMPFKPLALARTHEVHLHVLFVDGNHFLDLPVAGRQWLQPDPRVVHAEVPVARALVRPQEAAGLPDGLEHVVDIDPHVRFLHEERAGPTCLGVQLEHRQLRLLAVQHLHCERPVGQPVHAGQVEVLAKRPRQVEGNGRGHAGGLVGAAGSRHHEEADLGVRPPREGVPVILLGPLSDGLRARVHDAELGDVLLVHLFEGHLTAIRRDPETLVTVKLLLRQEVGEPVGHAGAASTGCEGAGRRRPICRDAVELLPPDEAHQRAVL